MKAEDFLELFGDPPDTQAILPPLCLELILRDGRSYSVHSLLHHDKRSSHIILRIWDLRALNAEDVEELLERLNDIFSRHELEPPEAVHPGLDWGLLRIDTDDIWYCIEWHDRMWPEGLKKRRIGFQA